MGGEPKQRGCARREDDLFSGQDGKNGMSFHHTTQNGAQLK